MIRKNNRRAYAMKTKIYPQFTSQGYLTFPLITGYRIRDIWSEDGIGDKSEVEKM